MFYIMFPINRCNCATYIFWQIFSQNDKSYLLSKRWILITRDQHSFRSYFQFSQCIHKLQWLWREKSLHLFNCSLLLSANICLQSMSVYETSEWLNIYFLLKSLLELSWANQKSKTTLFSIRRSVSWMIAHSDVTRN